MLASLRTFKDAGEIERIRHATDASIAAHFAAMHTVKPGVTEREVSALMQYEWGKRGCERPSYAPIVGSGFNSTVLHYSDDSGTMQSGDVVVIDAAGEYSMYASDITRTLPAVRQVHHSAAGDLRHRPRRATGRRCRISLGQVVFAARPARFSS